MGKEMERYGQLRAEHGELFVPRGGDAIRLLLDPPEVAEAERAAAERLSRKGLPAEWGQVGAVFEDQYLHILRDAVEFPNGAKGTYIRILSKPLGAAGAAVMPILDGRVVMLRHFRHATRAWHYEIPRGFAEPGANGETTARREIQEEIQGVIEELLPLGAMHTNTGLSAERVELFLAKLKTMGSLETDIGITACELWPLDQFDTHLKAGDVTDAFSLCAWTLARAKGYLYV